MLLPRGGAHQQTFDGEGPTAETATMRHVKITREPTMRYVKIVHEPGKPYPYGALDTKTGAVVLRQYDRETLVGPVSSVGLEDHRRSVSICCLTVRPAALAEQGYVTQTLASIIPPRQSLPCLVSADATGIITSLRFVAGRGTRFISAECV